MSVSGRELVPSPVQSGDASGPRSGRRIDSLGRSLLLVVVVLSLSVPAAGVAAASGFDLAANESATATDDDAANESGTSTTVPTESTTATETDTATENATATQTPTGTATRDATRTSSADTTAGDATTRSPSSDPVFEISNVSAPGAARIGDDVVVTATVTNRAAVGGSGRVNYSLAGRTVASERVSLAAGESRRVTFRSSVSDLEPGTYVHGVRNTTGDGIARRLRVTPDVDLSVRELDAPTEIARGESFVVLATVANPAETAITRNVSYAFDGVTVATKRVTVDAGTTERVAFESRVADLEPAVGPLANESVHTHAVVTGGEASQAGEVQVRRGAAADPGALTVEWFRTADDLRPGETLRVNVSLRNVAQAAFEGQLVYRLDGSALDTAWLRVPVGERRTVTFELTHDALERRGVPGAAGQTSHGVWVGDTPLQTRPIAIHGPFETPTETGTVTFTDDAGPVGGASQSNGAATTTPDADESCERGLLSPCGGTGLDETTLTLIGIATSMLGIVYEMVQG